jgi:uncharacterized protein
LAAEAPSNRVRVRRHSDRGVYEPEVIRSVLDAALYCHVGFVHDGQPFVIPTLHGRDGDMLYLHGAVASTMVRDLSAGVPVCVTASIIDGLVLARSLYNHSVNYRSVVVLGRAHEVKDPDEKLRALRAIVEHAVPGRFDDARAPSPSELKATRVVRLALDEASAKIRSGPPTDDPEDMDLEVWAGVLPVSLRYGTPEAAPEMPEGRPVPDYLTRR